MSNSLPKLNIFVKQSKNMQTRWVNWSLQTFFRMCERECGWLFVPICEHCIELACPG